MVGWGVSELTVCHKSPVAEAIKMPPEAEKKGAHLTDFKSKEEAKRRLDDSKRNQTAGQGPRRAMYCREEVWKGLCGGEKESKKEG